MGPQERMDISEASPADIEQAVACLARAFAEDPITGFLLQTGPGYPDRVAQFFRLLMRARIALGMPVFVARDSAGIQGAVMGYSTGHPPWPKDIAEDWDRFEQSIPGLTGRMAVYDGIAERGKPAVPHYYLGVIGAEPSRHGQGIGKRLLAHFCEQSARDPHSHGVYLETAKASNVPFYQSAGFVETARGTMGDANLWCLYLRHEQR